MVNKFKVTKLFNQPDLSRIISHYGFKRMSEEEIESALQAAFSDYILSALTELGGSNADHTKLYIEARHFIHRAETLLEGLPHPAGKMSFRLAKMSETLDKLIEGKDDFAAEKAARFMEKNLVRKLRDLWSANTATPFYAGVDGSGKNPRDFLLDCFNAANDKYPEIEWFRQVDAPIADRLIKSIKR